MGRAGGVVLESGGQEGGGGGTGGGENVGLSGNFAAAHEEASGTGNSVDAGGIGGVDEVGVRVSAAGEGTESF